MLNLITPLVGSASFQHHRSSFEILNQVLYNTQLKVVKFTLAEAWDFCAA